MKTRESKNLRYTKFPHGYLEGPDTIEAEKCILESFHCTDDRIELHFKNGTVALIEALNLEGGAEIDKIEARLKDSIGKSYEDILNVNL